MDSVLFGMLLDLLPCSRHHRNTASPLLPGYGPPPLPAQEMRRIELGTPIEVYKITTGAIWNPLQRKSDSQTKEMRWTIPSLSFPNLLYVFLYHIT
uniref:Uncharacterized protein n=1 Tax=Arundo donax TaxID=35708 RepID=A0A0A9GBL4_ARUDO